MTSIDALNKSNDEILLIAAEASSALYAQRLMQHFSKQGKNIKFYGIGSEEMAKEGFEALARSEDLAVVGLTEVVSNFPMIREVYYRLLSEAKKRNTKIAILMDYPGFNLRLAKKLKDLGLTVVYYIAPQLWAWKQGRVKQVRKYVDRMLVLFPFEVDFFREHGVQVDFVGHPLLDEIANRKLQGKERDLFRSRYGINSEDTVLGLMPGSRKSELRHHLDTQIEVARKLIREDNKVKVVLLVAPGLDKEKLQGEIGDRGLPVIFVQDDPISMLNLPDVVLCASGTATLLTGMMEVPMVIMYRMNAFTAFWAKRLVKNTPFFGMVNLVMGKQVAAELFQEEASINNLADHLRPFLDSNSLRQEKARQLSQVKERLGSRGATPRVAAIVEGLLK